MRPIHSYCSEQHRNAEVKNRSSSAEINHQVRGAEQVSHDLFTPGAGSFQTYLLLFVLLWGCLFVFVVVHQNESRGLGARPVKFFHTQKQVPQFWLKLCITMDMMQITPTSSNLVVQPPGLTNSTYFHHPTFS